MAEKKNNQMDSWDEESPESADSAPEKISKVAARAGRERGTPPVVFAPPEEAAPKGKVVASSPVKGINWTQVLLSAIVAVAISIMFVIKWAPGQGDLTVLRADLEAATANMTARDSTITALSSAITELQAKSDLWTNADYITEDTLEDAMGDYATDSEMAAFISTVSEMIAGIGQSAETSLLSLSTAYEHDQMMFNVSKAVSSNTTEYFTIEGTVYYDGSIPVTPTPTPMLTGFELTYATAGMSQFTMTEYGKTETGGVKGYPFAAPEGQWYYSFWLVPLSVGDNESSGSTW